MAIVQLKDVKVSFVNGRGYGFKVVEESESRGKTFKQTFGVWPTSETGIKVGDVISVSGFLSAKLGEPWTDRDGNTRQSVELSVNSPRVDRGNQAAQTEPQQDSYAAPNYNDETPF